MCGIAGFISREYSSSQLENMTTCLQHRGPDAKGYFFDEGNGVGLGHRRLSIIDLSEAANQPFYSADQRFVMVFNGELYNFKDVAQKYGINPRTSSDSEIIIEVFARKGVDCLGDFNGMFSMAIYDRKLDELFLMRDRFGKKPLLYYHSGDKLVFASELKAFFSLGIPDELDIKALQDYFFLEYVPGTQTIIRNIRKLPAGHYMQFKSGSCRISPYYDILDKFNPQQEIKEEAALDKLEELLSSSISLRQVSDVPIGAFLSGGTDSSLICALFQKQNKQPINTFTVGFDVAAYDETGYAKRVAEHIRSNHVMFSLNDRDSIATVDRLPFIYDEPFAAPSCIPSYLVCKKARQVVTVAMSGDGGDELFMGYGYYFYYQSLKKIFRFDLGLGRKLAAALMQQMGGRYERGARLFRQPDNRNLWLHTWSEEQSMFSEKEIGRLFGAHYSHTTLRADWETIDKLPLHDFEKISLFDIKHYLANNLLYKMDSASMANSLEVRNPFLDYRLVEFAINLPLHLRVRGKTQKYLMKKLLERYLPSDLVYRKKWGFPAPVGDWLYKDLSYLIDKWLQPKRIQQQGILDHVFVDSLVQAFRSGKKFHYKRIWSLIIFQMWFDAYMASNARTELSLSQSVA